MQLYRQKFRLSLSKHDLVPFLDRDASFKIHIALVGQNVLCTYNLKNEQFNESCLLSDYNAKIAKSRNIAGNLSSKSRISQGKNHKNSILREFCKIS